MPKITYAKRILDSDDKVGVDKYVNGIGENNPILELDEDIANRIVFHDDLVEALIEANDYIIETAPDDIYPERLLMTIEQALKKAGVEL